MSYNDLQERFRRDGVVHVPGAFTPDEMALLEEFWQFCLDHPGPSASRIYADKNEFVPGQGLDAARALPDRETGFAYQDVGNPANRPGSGNSSICPVSSPSSRQPSEPAGHGAWQSRFFSRNPIHPARPGTRIFRTSVSRVWMD